MSIEQIDMFDDEHTPAELLFKKMNVSVEFGQKYLVAATGVLLLGEHEMEQPVTLVGNLVRQSSDNIVLSDVYLREFDKFESAERYKEFVVIPSSKITELRLIATDELTFYHPYRLQLEERTVDGRKNIWLSCRFVGQTLSEQLLFLDYAHDKAILMLKKEEIKSIFPMSISEADELEAEILEKELVNGA